MKIYLIGSLRNPEIPAITKALQSPKHEVQIFSDWFAAGEKADDAWKDYEQALGHSYIEALNGLAAKHVFDFDKHHLDTSDIAVLAMPAGKSGFLELGYMIGRGKPGYILLDKAEGRWDVMFQFASGVFNSVDALVMKLMEDYSESLRRNEVGGTRACPPYHEAATGYRQTYDHIRLDECYGGDTRPGPSGF